MKRDPDAYEDVDRAVYGVGNDWPPSAELALHSHRRGQLLYAARGAVAVSTPQGAWVAPPERAVWIPPGTPHAVRMIGEVSTRSAMFAPEVVAGLGAVCKVIAISPLFSLLLEEAAQLSVEYDEDGRDGLLMRLVVAEIGRAPVVPLAVPFPRDAALAARCHAFLEAPDVRQDIDGWAGALGLNRRSFTRLFRRETGMSFAEWRRQACLAVALQRLSAGDAITDIALDLGYESPANFSTMFKRALGEPPSRHR